MKLILTLFCISLFLRPCFACITLESANNGKKSDAYVKHFHEKFDSERAIVIRNENNDFPCELTFNPAELIQNNDGSYRFLNAIPGLKLDRSLINYMDLKDKQGNSVFGKSLVINPNETKKYFFNFNFPQDFKTGSFHGAIRISYPQNPVIATIVEVYYSHEKKSTSIDLNQAQLNPDQTKVEYTLVNRGNHYTFFRFEVTVQDPQTGFTRSYYVNSDNEKRSFIAYIRNYPLAKDQMDTTISSQFRIEGFKQLFELEYKKEYPNADMPELLVMVILPSYGIDHLNWKNHFYKYLPRQTFTLTK